MGSCPFYAHAESGGEMGRGSPWVQARSGGAAGEFGAVRMRGGTSFGRQRQKCVEDRLLGRLPFQFPHQFRKATAAAGRPAADLLDHA